MKGTTIFGLFLLSSAFFYLPWATADDELVDTDGNLILNGGTYYILSAIWSQGGGIGFAKTGNETCPLTVVQDHNELSLGLPIRISSVLRVLHLSYGFPLDLAFIAVPTCAPTPSEWTVVKGLPQGPSVKLTGYENTISGSFFIEKSEYNLAYKLSFCERETEACEYIGIQVHDSQQTLVVKPVDQPLLVVFKKAAQVDA